MLNCVLEILKMTWCVAVGYSNKSFKKNWIKGISFYHLPKDENFKKKMASKYQEREFTKKSINLSSVFWRRLFQSRGRGNSN